LCYIFVEIVIFLKLGPWTGPFDPRDARHGHINLLGPCKNEARADPVRCQCKFMRTDLTRDGLVRLLIRNAQKEI